MTLPRPWTVQNNEDAYWIEASNGKRFAYTYFRREPMPGTGDTKVTEAEARALVSAVAEGVVLRPDAAVREALARFIASRPEELTEGQAAILLLKDALIGIGDLPLGSANRSPHAGK